MRELSSSTPSHFLGSWSPDGDSVTHVAFLPNALYKQNLLTNLVMSAVGRAKWVSDVVCGFDFEHDFEKAFNRKQDIIRQFGREMGEDG